MNTKIYTVAFCLLLALQGMSQQALSGTIQTSDYTTLIGASIVATDANGTQVGTISDTNGEFVLDLSTSGYYTIDVSYIGFTTYTVDVDMRSGLNTDLGSLILAESSQVLQSVEVIGRRRKDYNSDYSFSGSKVAILNKELRRIRCHQMGKKNWSWILKSKKVLNDRWWPIKLQPR